MEVKKPGFWSSRGLLYFAATAADLEVAVEDSVACLPPSSLFSVASVVWLIHYRIRQ